MTGAIFLGIYWVTGGKIPSRKVPTLATALLKLPNSEENQLLHLQIIVQINRFAVQITSTHLSSIFIPSGHERPQTLSTGMSAESRNTLTEPNLPKTLLPVEYSRFNRVQMRQIWDRLKKDSRSWVTFEIRSAYHQPVEQGMPPAPHSLFFNYRFCKF